MSTLEKNFSNCAGIQFPTRVQAHSLFTLSALFKDGNKAKLHSWRQEIRTNKPIIDHNHAWKRLFQLATVCTCQKKTSGCFLHQHQFITIYCNLTDQALFRSIYGKAKYCSDLHFADSDKGHTYLIKINSVDVWQLVKAHTKDHYQYYLLNK